MEIGTKHLKLNWKQKVVSIISSGLFFGLALPLVDFLLFNDVKVFIYYLIQGIAFGLLFGLTFPFLMNKINNKLLSKIAQNLKPTLDNKEHIENYGPANLLKGIEGTGGKLFLTNQNAIFVAHKMNIQKGETKIPYSDITEIEKRKIARLFDNGIRIKTRNDKNFDFTVNEREVWLEKLNEKIK